MSEKMTCPACGSHTSSVLAAYRDGEPCPSCGLTADAAAQILSIQRARADEALKAELTTVVRERDAVGRENERLRSAMEGIRACLEEFDRAEPQP